MRGYFTGEYDQYSLEKKWIQEYCARMKKGRKAFCFNCK
jgi:hypothetical protein